MILACIHRGGILDFDLKKILLIVQYVKNTSYNRILKCSPYEAMFGQNVVVEQKIENIFQIQEYANNDDDDENDEIHADEVIYRNNVIDKSRENVVKNIRKNAKKMLSLNKN